MNVTDVIRLSNAVIVSRNPRNYAVGDTEGWSNIVRGIGSNSCLLRLDRTIILMSRYFTERNPNWFIMMMTTTVVVEIKLPGILAPYVLRLRGGWKYLVCVSHSDRFRLQWADPLSKVSCHVCEELNVIRNTSGSLLYVSWKWNISIIFTHKSVIIP